MSRGTQRIIETWQLQRVWYQMMRVTPLCTLSNRFQIDCKQQKSSLIILFGPIMTDTSDSNWLFNDYQSQVRPFVRSLVLTWPADLVKWMEFEDSWRKATFLFDYSVPIHWLPQIRMRSTQVFNGSSRWWGNRSAGPLTNSTNDDFNWIVNLLYDSNPWSHHGRKHRDDLFQLAWKSLANK